MNTWSTEVLLENQMCNSEFKHSIKSNRKNANIYNHKSWFFNGQNELLCKNKAPQNHSSIKALNNFTTSDLVCLEGSKLWPNIDYRRGKYTGYHCIWPLSAKFKISKANKMFYKALIGKFK